MTVMIGGQGFPKLDLARARAASLTVSAYYPWEGRVPILFADLVADGGYAAVLTYSKSGAEHVLGERAVPLGEVEGGPITQLLVEVAYDAIEGPSLGKVPRDLRAGGRLITKLSQLTTHPIMLASAEFVVDLETRKPRPFWLPFPATNISGVPLTHQGSPVFDTVTSLSGMLRPDETQPAIYSFNVGVSPDAFATLHLSFTLDGPFDAHLPIVVFDRFVEIAAKLGFP